MSGRYSPSTVKNFPPLLRRLVRAAETECPPGYAEALVVFIGLALRKEPPRGILAPRAKPELNAAIRAIARAHFEVDEALAAWRRALTAADSVAGRHDGAQPDESVPRDVDAAHFYAGLAFGLVFAGPCAVIPWHTRRGSIAMLRGGQGNGAQMKRIRSAVSHSGTLERILERRSGSSRRDNSAAIDLVEEVVAGHWAKRPMPATPPQGVTR